MSRLPEPGGDIGTWGNVLNDFLLVEHNKDGSLRSDGSLADKLGVGGDIGGTASSPQVTGLHLTAPLTVAQGGTGAATQQFPVMRGAWQPNAAYSAKDIVQFQSGAFICVTSHTSSPNVTGQTGAFGADLTAGKWQPLSPRRQWYDIREYGAKIDNGNDTAAIQAAIDACAAAGGGVVFIPEGRVAVTTLTLKSHVWLRGAGVQATTIRLLSSTNGPVIKNYVSPNGVTANGEFCGVLDLNIDGNKAGNPSTNSHGISFSTNPLYTKATNDEQFDTQQLVHNVRIMNCGGVGLLANGRSESRLINVYAEKCDGGGIATSFDTYLQSCSAGNNAAFGFSFTHGSIMANNCKAFLAGREAGLNTPGFSMTGSALAVTLTGCIAQNNNGDGFYISNVPSVIMSGCAADSNNYGDTNESSDYVGVHLDGATYCVLDFVATQGYQAGVQVGNQASALRIGGGADYNDIRVSSYGRPGFTLGPTYTPDSQLLNNRITANGALLNPLPNFTDNGDVAVTNPSDGQTLQYAAASGKWVNSSAPIGSFAAGMLGDGSDGTATLDGAASVAWATLAGSTYTMTRDALTTSLTINPGITLACSGFRVFAQGTITNNGTISADGNTATSSTGASASISRSLGSGARGGNGNATAGSGGGVGGFGVGAGGAGGNGTSGNNGAAAISPLSTFNWVLKNGQGILSGVIGYGGTASAVIGGSGGSGGGGDSTNKGGGGGSGGGLVAVLARTFVNTGLLTAKGGNGYAPTIGNCGGGGGGGGGGIFVFTINPATNTGTTSVTGGAGAAGFGSGTTGGNGNAGTTMFVQMQ